MTCTSTPASCAPTADLIRTIHPDVALTLGDNQYSDGTLSSTSAATRSGRFKTSFPVAGNHEWKTPNAQGYLDYFHRGGYWYSFKVGMGLYALDGSCTDDWRL